MFDQGSQDPLRRPKEIRSQGGNLEIKKKNSIPKKHKKHASNKNPQQSTIPNESRNHFDNDNSTESMTIKSNENPHQHQHQRRHLPPKKFRFDKGFFSRLWHKDSSTSVTGCRLVIGSTEGLDKERFHR